MKKNKKLKVKRGKVLAVILVLGFVTFLFFYNSRVKLQVVTTVAEIDNYQYKMESNTTRIYKKYFKELEHELEDNKMDEENYASLVSKLFVIDYYTLNNKITNKNIGGVQFIHSNLRSSFIEKASNTMYKYIKSNLYGNRKQKLPEVNDVEIKSIKQINYKNNNYQDKSGYQVEVNINYVTDYDYPKEVTLTLIHEENKLVIVEIK
jgi:hypothetical protein